MAYRKLKSDEESQNLGSFTKAPIERYCLSLKGPNRQSSGQMSQNNYPKLKKDNRNTTSQAN